MKRINIITFVIAGGMLLLAACHSTPYQKEKGIYMPDMEYSRAYDTYGQNPIFANDMASRKPVKGTIKRGAMLPIPLPHSDSGYAYSGTLKNPININDSTLKEGKRLYDIFCAICHGSKLKGDGPLYNGGSGPFIAKPANFLAGPSSTLPAGTIYYVATYGLRNMASYSGQLNRYQRWMVVAYIKSVQRKKGITQAQDDAKMKSMEATYEQMH